MKLCDYWSERLRKDTWRAPGSPRIEAVYLPVSEFNQMVEEHNDLRDSKGFGTHAPPSVKEIRVLGTPIRRLELLPKQGARK